MVTSWAAFSFSHFSPFSQFLFFYSKYSASVKRRIERIRTHMIWNACCHKRPLSCNTRDNIYKMHIARLDCNKHLVITNTQLQRTHGYNKYSALTNTFKNPKWSFISKNLACPLQFVITESECICLYRIKIAHEKLT